MRHSWAIAIVVSLLGSTIGRAAERLFLDPIKVEAPPVSADPSVKLDYDIVYVRAPRRGDNERSYWAEIAHPTMMDAGANLMHLHPDGSEEVLVKVDPDCSVADPYVSFDGQWVYYALLRGLTEKGQARPRAARSADIYKVHVKDRRVVQLTKQEFAPNTGAADWADGFTKAQNDKTHLAYGVINTGPCPLPGGRIMFTSNRNVYRPPNGYPTQTLQLFVMDEDGSNIEQVGYFNIAGVLHPSILKDGRVLFSTLESQALHNNILWGIWSIHPDGSKWNPVVSAFDPGSAPNAFHFQTQLSDGSIIVEEYYNLNNNGMGAYFKLPQQPAEGYAAFGPGYRNDARNVPLRFGRFDNGKGMYYRLPFTPYGAEAFTPFANNGEGEANSSVIKDRKSPAVGKYTHPSGAPDNHMLTVWATGPGNHQNSAKYPMPDAGIYLIKDGTAVDEPAQMRLIKNDPAWNEQWPRAVVSYQRIYGVKEPARIAPVANDGKLSPHLPEGTPFGLVGSSSLYKRESFPNGAVPKGSVTASFAGKQDSTGGYGGLDPFNTSENGATLNWFNQGADAGKYSNDDIHAIRILVMEPTTDRHRGPNSGRLFFSHAMERLRILGEIPVRKFDKDGKQPVDPDGNPDTSFLAKIPADTAFTFQTIDKDGMVLNMAQTWHQVRPGEIRNDCGGCHAHSQQPTDFAKTAAALPDYKPFDLTKQTPLLAKQPAGETGVRHVEGLKNVEFFHDIKPILNRSCVACHKGKFEEQMGRLALDDETPQKAGYGRPMPASYMRLAKDDGEKSHWGYPPLIHNGSWRNHNASRYVRKFQSRRSLLVWKVFGKRTDGWTNDDFPSETVPGEANSMKHRGEPVANTPQNRNRADLDYNGHSCPPPEAVAGTYVAPDGSKIKVEPLSDEDRMTIVRWIDLGCPIDLDPAGKYGWMGDDQRPTLTVTYPRHGDVTVSRIVVGAWDVYRGLDEASLSVKADFPIAGTAAGTELAKRMKPSGQGTWELKLDKPFELVKTGTLVVSIKDRQGNIAKVERTLAAPASREAAALP